MRHWVRCPDRWKWHGGRRHVGRDVQNGGGARCSRSPSGRSGVAVRADRVVQHVPDPTAVLAEMALPRLLTALITGPATSGATPTLTASPTRGRSRTGGRAEHARDGAGRTSWIVPPRAIDSSRAL